MEPNELIKLRESISKKLEKHKQKVLFIMDFDGTLIDTFNSVLIPILKSIDIDIGTYKEFSNRNGSYKKYIGSNGHRIDNLKKYYKLDKHEFQRTLKEIYLQNAKKIKETYNLIKELSHIQEMEFGIVSKNYISNSFNPEDMIQEIVKKLRLFEKEPMFIKRISPKEHKKKYFENIRNKYPKHIIISLGDEIGDYISATLAKFDSIFAIEGFDSKELFNKHDISVTLKEKLNFNILYAIEKKIYDKFDLYEQSHLVEH